MSVRLEPLRAAEDREWCAHLLSSNEPWITLRRDYAACHAALSNPTKECYLVWSDTVRAGVLILDMTGPFPGYIQTICLASEARNRGIGSEVLGWAERRILGDSPNVFICVSSFNPGARRLYERLGYTVIGTLKGYVVDEHDELLLHKRTASWESFKPGTPFD